MAEQSGAEQAAAITKAFAGAGRDVAIGLSILLIVGWLVIFSRPLQWAHIRVGTDGLEIKAVAQEVEAMAKQLEKSRSDLHTLEGRVGQIVKALGAYEASKTEEKLAELAALIRGTQAVASNVVAQADESSVKTARALTRVEEVQAKVERRDGKQADAPAAVMSGWYYLGKISRSGAWLPSSALGTLVFEPPVDGNRDVLQQIQVGKTFVKSKGYKYLRSTESATGRRVDAAIARVLPPGTRARIVGLDTSGTDPADGETVVWASVELTPSPEQ